MYGHQFKATARECQAIANDIKDVMREHGIDPNDLNAFRANLGRACQGIVDMLETEAIRAEDEYNDRD